MILIDKIEYLTVLSHWTYHLKISRILSGAAFKTMEFEVISFQAVVQS